MNEEKGFSLLLKIIITAILLILVVVAIFAYSNKLEKKNNQNSLDLNSEEKIVVNQEKLIEEYKNELIKIIDNFDSNLENLQKQITEIPVPNGFQELHLKLVLSFNSALYEDDLEFTKEKIKEIAKDNEWLENSLDKLISNIK